jgi:methylated-DNA-[protein]-cysteine S-methyltransferase
MKTLFIHSFGSKWGTFRTAATSKFLVLVAMPGESEALFDDRIAERFKDFQLMNGGLINKQAEKEIRAYLDGRQKKFTVKFNVTAAPFHKKVLKYVARIPFGVTKTYGDIAAGVGNPRASRAVGTANAKNNLPLIIPCHRVVGCNGLGGYGGGLSLKRKLLIHEGVSQY